MAKITDQNKNVVASYSYDAWGNILSLSGSFANSQPFRYAGYLYDSETGLYYLIHRYYDPKDGRFISEDPLASGKIDNISRNPYVYVKNNPINATDPSGLETAERNCSISGRVTDGSGRGVDGVNVRICNTSYEMAGFPRGDYIQWTDPSQTAAHNATFTHGGGYYSFTQLPGDCSYNIFVKAEGMGLQEYWNVYLGVNEKLTYNVTLGGSGSQGPSGAPPPGPVPTYSIINETAEERASQPQRWLVHSRSIQEMYNFRGTFVYITTNIFYTYPYGEIINLSTVHTMIIVVPDTDPRKWISGYVIAKSFLDVYDEGVLKYSNRLCPGHNLYPWDAITEHTFSPNIWIGPRYLIDAIFYLKSVASDLGGPQESQWYPTRQQFREEFA